MLAVFRHFHDGMRASIRTDDGESSTDSAWGREGLRRGCVLAPLLFNMSFTAVLLEAVERFSVNADVGDRYYTHHGEGREGSGGGGERGRSEKGRDTPQETLAEPQPIWVMLSADDEGIVCRSTKSLAKMMEHIVAVWGSLGLPVSEAKTIDHVRDDETRMDRVISDTEAARQMHKQTINIIPSLCTLGQL